MRSAIRIEVFNANHLLAGGCIGVRRQRFELEQTVNDESDGGGKLVERGTAGRFADGEREAKSGFTQGFAQALVGIGGVSLILRLVSFNYSPHPRPLSLRERGGELLAPAMQEGTGDAKFVRKGGYVTGMGGHAGNGLTLEVFGVTPW
jgi:hypothetical protein